MSRTTRAKKMMPPPEPQLAASEFRWWLRLRVNSSVSIDAFADADGLNCYAQHFGLWSSPTRTPAEALRQAYGALGVALDQAEDAFAQVQEQEQGEVK